MSQKFWWVFDVNHDVSIGSFDSLTVFPSMYLRYRTFSLQSSKQLRSNPSVPYLMWPAQGWMEDSSRARKLRPNYKAYCLSHFSLAFAQSPWQWRVRRDLISAPCELCFRSSGSGRRLLKGSDLKRETLLYKPPPTLLYTDWYNVYYICYLVLGKDYVCYAPKSYKTVNNTKSFIPTNLFSSIKSSIYY